MPTAFDTLAYENNLYTTWMDNKNLVVYTKKVYHNGNEWTETQVWDYDSNLKYAKVYKTFDVDELGMYHDEMIHQVKSW